MLPASGTASRRGRSPPPSGKSPLRPSTPGDVAQSRKKGKNGKNAVRKDSQIAKTEAKTLLDDFESPPITSTPISSIPSQFPARSLQNTFDSPVMDAINALAPEQDPEIAIRTGSWAKSIPFGKSPPVGPINEEIASESPPAFALHGEKSGLPQSPASISPSVRKPRPVSLGNASLGNGYISPSPSNRQSRDRQPRHSAHAPYQSNPPLPHMPQAHFYSVPDIDIPGASPQTTGRAQEAGYSYCALDTLATPAVHRFTPLDSKVLLVGRDGALEIMSLDKGAPRLVGTIDGLNGRVLDAKLLTWRSGSDPFRGSRPLVAITLHGPVQDDGANSSAISDHTDFIPGIPGRLDGYSKREDLPHVQTRVQVYSLRTREFISTLLATKPEPCYTAYPGSAPSLPPPAGNLKLYASGNYVVVASGTSGEVFVFHAVKTKSAGTYQCLGKAWTNVQMRESRRHSGSSTSTDADDFQSDNGMDMPILSLSDRWLAIVSPSPHRVALRGTTVAPSRHKRNYSIEAHTPPARASVNCAVDSGEGESLLNKVARGVTQGLVWGAGWIGDQGLQTWNNYWNKDTHASQAVVGRRGPPFEPHPVSNLLPPTHGTDTQAASRNEPDLVSIIDLKRFESHDSKSSFLTPFATFQSPEGCSFLSFSPSGLMLLTASGKGDAQYVWDLMQTRHCRSKPFMTKGKVVGASGVKLGAAHVRQVAKFTRLTTSNIVDVVWSVPAGEHLALITKKGTIHVFDMPRSAFHWPPPRRVPAKSIRQRSSDNSLPEEYLAGTNSGNAFSSAVKLVGGSTQPIIAAVRGRAPSMGAFTSSRGSNVVAATLSKSLGTATETVLSLRHVGENRLHLHSVFKDGIVSRVTWFGDEHKPSLGIIDNGSFKHYLIRRGLATTKNGKQAASVFGPKIREVRLPPNARIPCPYIQPFFPASESGVTGFYSAPPKRPLPHKLKPPLANVEIDTSAPYQPYHTDRRANYMVYTSDYDEENEMWTPWEFGTDIPCRKLHIRGRSFDEEACAADPEEMENIISLGGSGKNVEYAVITRRRKKNSASGDQGGRSGEEEGFFEDDCDVLDFATDRV